MRAAAGALSFLGFVACSSPVSPPAGQPQKAAAKDTSEPLLFVSLPDSAQAARWIETASAVERSAAAVITANGRLVANEDRSWHIGAITGGRIVEVMVNLGDKVKTGQVLARLHSHDIHEERASYRKAQSELERARSSLALAQRTRDRARRLYDLKAGSLEQVELTEQELLRARNAVAAGEIEIERVRAHLVEFLGVSPEPAPGHKAGEHEHDDDLVAVRSSGDGVLIKREVTVGDVVTAGSELFLVSDLTHLWMIAAVEERHLPNLREGQAARITVPALPNRTFPGRIAKLGEQMDPATRTLQVRVDLVSPGGLLKPESFATVELITGGAERSISVPPGAVQEVSGHATVFVVRAENRYEVRPVSVGRSSAGGTEIREGLAAGERVVVKGAFLLKSQLLKSALEGEE